MIKYSIVLAVWARRFIITYADSDGYNLEKLQKNLYYSHLFVKLSLLLYFLR